MPSFESIKREAVQLERQLEDKISRYQHLAQRWNAEAFSSAAHSPVASSNSLSRDSVDNAADLSILQQDITSQLQQLQECIDRNLTSAATTANQRAVCQRYRDISADLKADYDKARHLVQRAKERRELLAGSNASHEGNSMRDAATDHLLRERNHIQNSLSAASNVIGQAESVRADLQGQGRSLRSTSTLLTTLTANVPGLNHLVEQIRRKRSRDDKIVAGVIASCILFTLWYLFG